MADEIDAVPPVTEAMIEAAAEPATATKKTRKPRTTGALLAVTDDTDETGNPILVAVETPTVFTAVDQLQKHLDKTVSDTDDTPIRVYRYIGTYTKKVKRRVASAIK